MDRMFSILQVKSYDDEQRIIRGVATTPEPDRVGDIVVSTGVKFKNPSPLLWQHEHDKPVGTVKFDKPTDKGITFEAQLPKIEEPGALKDRVDEAWQSVKAGLVTAVSIGFRVLDDAYEVMKSGGLKFLKTEVMELSLVTIPANASAQITQIKQYDTELRAAHGREKKGVVFLDPPPGASGTPKQPASGGFSFSRNEGSEMKTLAEQIKAWEQSIDDKTARRDAIQTKATEEGRTKDTAERTEFEELSRDIVEAQKELEDLRVLEQSNIEKAKKAAPLAQAEPGRLPVVLKEVEKLEPGQAMARYAMCLGKARGDHHKAFRFAEQHYPKTENVVKLLKAQSEGANVAEIIVQKATVAAGSTSDSTWASPLVYAQNFGGDFITYLRARTLIGQAQFRPIPFNVRVGSQTSGGTAGWVGQGKAKPVTKFDFVAQTTGYTKVAGIAVLTQELIRLSDPSAEMLVRDSLADCVIERIDSDLFDPDVAAVANVNPAGLLNGVNPIAGTIGDDAESIRAAILRLWAPWDSSFMGARPAYYTTPAVARYLASLREMTGTASFPGIGPNGGVLDGVPLRTSQYLANNGGSGGAPFILVDESEVYLADDGNVTLDASEQASVEMSSTPAGSSVTSVAASSTNFVSMWQTNSVAFRAERWIWWGLRRTGAIQWIDGFPTSS